MNVCPNCGQLMPTARPSELTLRELIAISAWWHTGSVKKAAVLAGVAEQTMKNQLRSARNRSHVTNNLDLASAHIGALWSLAALLESHNLRVRVAA